MTVTSVNFLYSEAPELSVTGTRRYVSHYEVQTDDKDDGPLTVATAAALPGRYSPYQAGNDTDLGAFSKTYSVTLAQEAADHLRRWRVAIGYDSEPLPESESDYEDDPLLEEPILSGGFLSRSVAATKDKDDNPIVNAAGDLFEGLSGIKSDNRLTIQMNTAELDLTTINASKDKVNSTTFFGQSARKARFADHRWTQQFRGSGDPYYQQVFEFEFDDDTWDMKPANRGYRSKTTGGEIVKADDDKGFPTSDLIWLTTGGVKAASTGPYLYYDGAAGLNAYQYYKTMDFADLGVPTSHPTIV